MLPNEDDLEFLRRLTAAAGPSGFETPVQRVWVEQVRDAAANVQSDAYGNVWAELLPGRKSRRSEAPPTVLVAGHADEIGLMINHIETSGLLRVVPIGGVDAAILPGRRVIIHGPDGPIPAVIGAVPIHLQTHKGERRTPRIDEVFLDGGFTSEQEVRDAGLRVGLPVTLADGFERIGERRVISRALDNRIGVWTAATVLRRLAARRRELHVRVIALSTVQEEIGGIGALVATRTIDPDLAFVVDVTHATDVPGVPAARHGKVTLGGGPTLTHGTSNHPALVRRLGDVAKRCEIPIQHEASSRYTGTDTDLIYRSTRGIPSALVSLPNRYMHTPAEMIDLSDLEKVAALLVETILDLRPAERFVALPEWSSVR
jgi:endoglucanase